MQSKYQDIVVDAGGADNEALRAALSLADLAIFPIVPSEFDMWTFETLSNLVASVPGNLSAKVLLNNPNYGLNKEIKVQLRRGKQGKLEYFSNN